MTDKKRIRILSQLTPIDFRVVLLIANKQEFASGSPLKEYKKSFIKFLHQRLYDRLYHVYPKLRIIEDEIGTTEFQASFKKYVAERRPRSNLLTEYDFGYCDSKDEILVQLADLIGGSVNHFLLDNTAPNCLEMLRGKILVVDEFPNKHDPYWGKVNPEYSNFDKDIYALSVKCASDFIDRNEASDLDEKIVQVAFLRYLLLQVQNINPTRYIYSNEILTKIKELTNQRISRNFLYRKVIAPLRDAGIIIASSSHGYKIPISVDDIKTYLNSTHSVVSPMLHRIGVCRALIKQQTNNRVDVLDDPAFFKYKKYFD